MMQTRPGAGPFRPPDWTWQRGSANWLSALGTLLGRPSRRFQTTFGTLRATFSAAWDRVHVSVN